MIDESFVQDVILDATIAAIAKMITVESLNTSRLLDILREQR